VPENFVNYLPILRWYSNFLEKVLSKEIAESINCSDQLVDILMKSLRGSQTRFIYNKLGVYDLYALARGGALKRISNLGRI